MKKEPHFAFIPPNEIEVIIPLLSKLNEETSVEILKERVREMSQQNYKCVGIYSEDALVGICGLWFMTRHYSGRSIEPDHVYIDKTMQSQGIGEKLFAWIEAYAKSIGYNALELNTYVRNTRSHKFYYNTGFEILGYHFVKFLNKP